ncbi:hypothetical protein QBC43DRAFT_289721 [Cladorrhinum sp. PSN259]|nr:hypothetical protein QBC43DRAFT_289721 [Cladorrhinum sp. PSN259]
MDYLTTKLPIEIIDMILANFCQYCNQDSKGIWNVFSITGNPPGRISQEIRAKQRDLSSLCLTSRAINKSAARHLYHAVSPHFLTTWWLLARTLIQRPDLAQHVKRLVGTDYCIREQHLLSIRKYCKPDIRHVAYQGGNLRDIASDLDMDFLPLQHPLAIPWNLHAAIFDQIQIQYPPEVTTYYESSTNSPFPNSSSSSSLGGMMRLHRTLGFSILITLCPKLEQLSLPCFGNVACAPYNNNYEFVTQAGKPLSALKMFAIQVRSLSTGVKFSGRLLDRPSLECIVPFFNLAPNLEVLSLPGLDPYRIPSQTTQSCQCKTCQT